jgi:hypothetical protein
MSKITPVDKRNSEAFAKIHELYSFINDNNTMELLYNYMKEYLFNSDMLEYWSIRVDKELKLKTHEEVLYYIENIVCY